MDLPPRRWLVRGVLALVVGSLVIAAAVSAVAYEPPSLGPGTVEQPANGSTVVSVQGFHFEGVGNAKKPARLVSAGPRAESEWVYDGSKRNARWFYDVDPLANGNLLVTSTVPGDTVVFELDPDSQKRVWTERFDAEDTHDVDLINGDQLLVANMREYNGSSDVSNDRLFVYDRSKDEIVWDWQFREHFPNATDGGFSEDWSHVNDVDKIGDGKYLASPRNFDQAIVVDRQTGNITMRLGRDGELGTLYEQHNPDYLESENGTPTILVADSENDRIVEYARVGGPPGKGEWRQTWNLTGDLNWPRDADRLPNGNTLVVDSMNHRVIEVTPAGEVVWEMDAPWATYDAERIAHGDEPDGPTITDQNASGNVTLYGGSETGVAGAPTIPSVVKGVVAKTPLPAAATGLAESWRRVSPWFKPTWMPIWAFSIVVVCLGVVLVWGVGESVYQRRRIQRRFVETFGGVRDRLS